MNIGPLFFFKQRFGMILGDDFFCYNVVFFGFAGWREVQKKYLGNLGPQKQEIKTGGEKTSGYPPSNRPKP